MGKDETKSAEDLYYTLDNITPSYNVVHIFKCCADRLKNLKALINKTPIDMFLITDDETSYIQNYINANYLSKSISVNLVVACLTRVVLDNRIYGFISEEELQKSLETFRLKNSPENHDIFATLNLIDAFTETIGSRGQLKIRNSHEFVKNYRLYDGIVREPDTHDYTSSTLKENSIYLHKRFSGMIESYPRINIKNLNDLNALFSEENLSEIASLLQEDPHLADILTIRKNYSSIITNGTAVLGLGDIGADAGLPVMEGKCILFKTFGRVNMMPICIKEKDPDQVIKLVKRLSPIFMSINLEDIKGPECFKIERTLRKICEPAIFHDDQHGTAIIVVAAFIN